MNSEDDLRVALPAVEVPDTAPYFYTVSEDDNGALRDIERFDPAGTRHSGPMVVR